MYHKKLWFILVFYNVLVVLMVANFYGSIDDKTRITKIKSNPNLKYHEHNKESKLALVQKIQECSPNFHWAFIKTHKSGSSTVKSVVWKFVVEHKKPIVQEFPYALVGGYPGHIKTEFVVINESGKARLAYSTDDFSLTGHFRFNSTALKHLMPQDTLYFSVLRDPWRNFQSSFYFYYNPIGRVKKMNRATCANYPYFHVAKGRRISFLEYLKIVFESLNDSIPWFFRSKNYQAHDLGLDPLLDDDLEIDRAVEKLGSQIDLVMITDYMDESMILLKNLLCMSWSDIIYKSYHISNEYTPIYFDQNTTVMKKFNKFYKLDIALYDYFNRTFWKKVDTYGRQRMMNDVKKLRLLRQEDENKVTSIKTSSRKGRYFESLSEIEMQDIFKESLKNRHHESMLGILKKKLFKANKIANEKLLDSLAEYMVQNNGGCPVEL